ncbi:MAG: hypothetical protein LQ341_004751 [Variospora aurantia]|nr:MAG: hypothetical protein LQ341_004751 [Variospora aurantia]
MELHQRFGSLLRLAPNLVSFDDPRMIPEVYQKCLDKTTFYTPAVMGETPSMFWTLNHKDHALKKRLFAPSVSHNFKHMSRFPGSSDFVD